MRTDVEVVMSGNSALANGRSYMGTLGSKLHSFFDVDSTPLRMSHKVYTAFSLLLITVCGAYARFYKLTSVGLLDGDDFFYYKWAYNWFVNDYNLFGLYRIANPIIGKSALAIFGVNDYSIHIIVCIFGLLNIIFSFIVSYLSTRSTGIALAVSLVHALSLRVVEVDRTLIPYTITETFFLLSCIAYIKSLSIVLYNFSSKNFCLLYMAFSGLLLSIAAHAHWEVACHGATMFIFIFLFNHCISEKPVAFSIIASMLFSVGFWGPIFIGMLVFSPTEVMSGILNVTSTLKGMALQKDFSALGYSIEIFSLLKVVVVKNTGSFTLGFMFFAALFCLFFGRNYSMTSGNNSTHRLRLATSYLFIFLIAFYIITIKAFKMDSFLKHWHAQHLATLVLCFTLYWFNNFIRSLFKKKLGQSALVFSVFLFIVWVQSQPWEVFTTRFHSPTPYRAMGNVLSKRVTNSDRVLITPYLVLDFRYQTLTPPSYLTKEFVDHIFEYTSDLPFERQVSKNGIRYLVIATDLVHEQSGTQIGVKANLGRAYGLTPEAYSLSDELALLKTYITHVNAVLLYKAKGVEIYDLRPGS